MDRTEVEKAVQNAYATRLSNEPDRVAALFADDAVFELAGGSPDATNAFRAEGRRAIADAFETVARDWIWLGVTVHDTIIDGHRAAVRYTANQRYAPTGEVVDMELFDLIEFRGGLIARFVEHYDSELAMQVVQRAPDAMKLAERIAVNTANRTTT